MIKAVEEILAGRGDDELRITRGRKVMEIRPRVSESGRTFGMDKAWFLLLSIKLPRLNFSGFFVSILSSLSRSIL